MRRPTFDLDVLRTFVTGVELNSFAKAADRLGRGARGVPRGERVLQRVVQPPPAARRADRDARQHDHRLRRGGDRGGGRGGRARDVLQRRGGEERRHAARPRERLRGAAGARPRQGRAQPSPGADGWTWKELLSGMDGEKVDDDVLAERLADKSYNSESSSNMSKEIADAIKGKIKSEMELPRYKLVVQVVIGEQRGQGLRMGCRGVWDVDTDNYAEDTYRSDSLFCHAAAFGVYLY